MSALEPADLDCSQGNSFRYELFEGSYVPIWSILGLLNSLSGVVDHVSTSPSGFTGKKKKKRKDHIEILTKVFKCVILSMYVCTILTSLAGQGSVSVIVIVIVSVTETDTTVRGRGTATSGGQAGNETQTSGGGAGRPPRARKTPRLKSHRWRRRRRK